MAGFDGKFESTKQDWTTPQWLFDVLNDKYNFNFDLAASDENALCTNYYTEEQSALDQEWIGNCWLNPPYGGRGKNKLPNWVRKSYEESQLNTTITILIPARTNTVWWHEYCMKATDMTFLKGRPKFGGAKYGLPQPLAVLHFARLGYNGFPNLLSLNIKKRKFE